MFDRNLYNVKQKLLTLVHQIRIGVDPALTFEELDEMNVTMRAQNEVINEAETTNKYGMYIVNRIADKPYLFR